MIFYVFIVLTSLVITANCVTIKTINNERIADFSDEASGTKTLNARSKNAEKINTTSLLHLTSVKTIVLKNNKLSEFPDFRPVADILKSLNLEQNKITHINPDYVSDFKALEFLLITWNKITSFPSVQWPDTMQRIEIGGNPLSEVPRFDNLTGYLGIGKCRKIKNINMESFRGMKISEFNAYESSIISFPNFKHVADTLKEIRLSKIPTLNYSGNVELAILKKVKYLNILDTNIKLLTSTCPENNDTIRIDANTLDLCSCQMIWLKVRKVKHWVLFIYCIVHKQFVIEM